MAEPVAAPEAPRSIRRDVAAIALAAFTTILAVSLFTFDPADPVEPPVWPLSSLYTPDALVFPQNGRITNACGYWGAILAGSLLTGAGVGACLVVSVLGGTAIAILLRGGVSAPMMRSLGWTLVLLSLTTGASLSQFDLAHMPLVGAGGYLGAMSSAWLRLHFASAGAWILTFTCLMFGMLMATDYILVYATGKVASTSAKTSVAGLRQVGKILPKKSLHAGTLRTDIDDSSYLEGDDADEPQDEAEPVSQPSVRIRGRKPEQLTAADDVDALVETAPEIEAEVAEEPQEVAEPEAPEPQTRDIVVEDETVNLRLDPPHEETPDKHELKVKTKQNRKPNTDSLSDAMREQMPEGADDYLLPSVTLLDESDDICYDDQLVEVRRKARLLEQAFADFNLNVRVKEIETGPVIAQYEVELEKGLRLNKITGLADDLAIALRVPTVRIVAPIPGKNTVGIEVPNDTRQTVHLREVIEECAGSANKMNIPIFLGKDVSGNPLTVDLAKMPHLLIAGRTGTGKSVCLNSIITSILMTRRPDEVRMLMIDPKMVELSGYGRLPHLMHPVVTDMKKAEAILSWAVDKMEERYALLAKVGVRHINGYNQLGREELERRFQPEDEEQAANIPDHLPFIVIVADEMADLMMTSGKDAETHIIRLAQKSRAVGIHLILATQKPTVDVITGLIKSNLPARLSFQVASSSDSRVVLDANGADKLLGNGDMLFLWPGTSTMIRGQGTYLGDDEIDRVVDHCSMTEQNFVGELMNLKVKDEEGAAGGEENVTALRRRDDLYESAIEVVLNEGRGSLSLLQRALGIGYGRAARMIDFMAEDGIVGQYNGAQAREVIITASQWEAMKNGSAEAGEPAKPKKKAAKPLRAVSEPNDWDDDADLDDDEMDVVSMDYEEETEDSWET
ncbi:DNA translocase FtsK [Rosistilla carotiformis]|uniref:DNA translocase FtsK n=1 Tax=Rosistilla carotiformis TaxID=2528017 RepID=A0A518JTS1_9BACT|nr:DNA translocase FtsK [Rosistilla carotiformis]QDV68866.1 DNA translocase FtsK [Rosistilla carotiformis]